MLEIYINEQLAEIDNSFPGIPLQINSLLLTEKGQHSFTFSIPVNNTNNEILDIYTFPTNYNVFKKKSCRIRFNTFIIEGYVILENIGDEIELYFVGWENIYFSQIDKLKLTDLGYSTAFTSSDLNTACLNNNGIYCLFPVDISTPNNIKLLEDPNGADYWNDKVYLNYYVLSPTEGLKTNVFASNLQAADPDAVEIYDFTNKIHGYILPFYYLNYVLTKIFDYFGINVESNPFSSGDLNKLAIVYNGKYFNSLANDTISFADHLPDITVNSFLRKIEEIFDLQFVLNPFTQSVKIVFLKDKTATSSVVDISNKINKIKKLDTIDPKNYYHTQKIDFDLFLSQSDFPNYNINNDSEYEIKTKEINASFKEALTDYMHVKTVTTAYITWYYNKFYRIFMGYDIVEGQENGKLFEDKPFRLAFHTTQTEYTFDSWREDGVTGSLGTGTLPRGSYWLGSYSLKFNQAGKGLYEVFYKNVQTWKNKFAKNAIINAVFNSADLSGFDFLQKYKVGDITVLIKTIPVTLHKNKIEIGDIEAITV